ncbi:MAG TPA: glycosyltransferase [Methylomirabilota bacterium]|nr:glycosyltransferase [Methylomirabilota bacterium]
MSIIVPVYNDAPNLGECLAALKAAVIPGCELLVVDDASSDDSSLVARRAEANAIRLEQNSGPATARNRGAAAARGEILFFVDADVAVAPDAIRRVDAAFSEDPQLGAVFGSYDATPRAPGMVSQYRNLLHHFVHQQGNPDASTFWAGCGAVRRACFTEVGGFDDGQFRRPAIEDIELGYRLRRFGYRILLDKRLQGKHFKAWTLYSVVKTDILSRAVPWSLLMLEGGGAPNDLNLKLGQRVSGLLVLLAAAATLLATLHPRLLGVSGTALGAVVALNWPLYRFFLARRGPWFLARALPLHWLYYFYSSLTYLAVWGVVQARRAARRFGSASAPHTERDERA